MKKILLILALVMVAGALWFVLASGTPDYAGPNSAGVANNAAGSAGDGGANDGSLRAGDGAAVGVNSNEHGGGVAESGQDGEGVVDTRSATEVYKTAAEALEAIKNAASTYDDLVLDQFTNLGEHCTWCDAFYSGVKEMLQAADLKPDQRSYYAEVLAVSGRVDNVKTLSDLVLNSKNQAEADQFAEALELTVGGEEVVRFLGEQLNQQNTTLKEASVAAMTNQGSRLAIELLYNNTVQRGDPDGYYSMGIGLGEMVPEPESLPYLQDLVMKRDQYSHLTLKTMLNGGADGLKSVLDVLSSSPNPDFDKEMLKGAKDHVVFDEESSKILQDALDRPNTPQHVKDWAKETLDDLNATENSSAEEDEAESLPETPAINLGQ